MRSSASDRPSRRCRSRRPGSGRPRPRPRCRRRRRCANRPCGRPAAGRPRPLWSASSRAGASPRP
ncbi:hypothetical protein DTO57_09570 [Microbacterium sorbitolivorans]|uniref:Uncharacterized protein n=1 Tax=Microbacterium sorbitolivorans TaxID=1867410 RepID=A0A367XYL8_9MICO|nr:hypothetical protein DTO57_09570 [Microbacterium sorbitolivorans]